MTFATGNVTITSTGAPLIAGNASLRSLQFENIGSTTVYVAGSANVSGTTGFPVMAGQKLPSTDYIGSWFGATAAGTGTLRWIREA